MKPIVYNFDISGHIKFVTVFETFENLVVIFQESIIKWSAGDGRTPINFNAAAQFEVDKSDPHAKIHFRISSQSGFSMTKKEKVFLVDSMEFATFFRAI